MNLNFNDRMFDKRYLLELNNRDNEADSCYL